MREWRQRFGYDYEVIFPGIRRLFITGKEVVLAAEQDGKPYLIVDERTCTDFNAPDSEDKMHALLSVIEFHHSGERVQYLNDHFGQLSLPKIPAARRYRFATPTAVLGRSNDVLY